MLFKNPVQKFCWQIADSGVSEDHTAQLKWPRDSQSDQVQSGGHLNATLWPWMITNSILMSGSCLLNSLCLRQIKLEQSILVLNH